MSQTQPLLALSTSTIHAVDNGAIPPLSPLTPIGGDGDAGGGRCDHCAQSQTQTVLPLQLTETRRARIERIARLLEQVPNVRRASDVTFTEANERRARRIAQADQAPESGTWIGPPGGFGSFRNHPGQCGVAAINPLFYTHDANGQ